MDYYELQQLKVLAEAGDKEAYTSIIEYYMDFEGGTFNDRLAAYYSVKLYELDQEYSMSLGLCYQLGIFFPKIYPFAKYCYMKSGFSDEEMNENFSLEDEGLRWEDINSIQPAYPEFSTDVEGFFTARSSCDALTEALMYKGEIHNDEINEIDPEKSIRCFEEAIKYNYSEALISYVMAHDYTDESASLRFTDESKTEIDLFGYMEKEQFINLTYTAASYGNFDAIKLIILNIIIEYYEKNDDEDAFKAALDWIAIRLQLFHYIEVDPKYEPIEEYEKYQNYIKDTEARTKEREIASNIRRLNVEEKERNIGDNAIYISSNGNIKLIQIDFSNYSEMDEIINAKRTDTLSTQTMKNLFIDVDVPIVGYCDRNAFEKGLSRNNVAEKLTGYSQIYGDIVICGYLNEFVGIADDEIDMVLRIINRIK